MSRFNGRRFLVTGGTGFIGSALVRGLLREGATVRSFDDNSRGAATKLGDRLHDVEIMTGDVRDAAAVRAATRGVDTVCHLAYVNGTEFFYAKPDVILEIAVKGMMNVLDACLAENVGQLIVASSSEVYQDAGRIPTPEDVPLVVPDISNPRYSYGGGKIISELLTMNYGRKHFERAVVFRPHNVYGPDMGAEHVIPQFAMRMRKACEQAEGRIAFRIQGTGRETRAFIYIDDFTEGLLRVIERGEHCNVYNIGTDVEVTIEAVARLVAGCFGREVDIIPGPMMPGSVPRRSPDITKLRALGFEPVTSLETGIAATVGWYQGCGVV